MPEEKKDDDKKPTPNDEQLSALNLAGQARIDISFIENDDGTQSTITFKDPSGSDLGSLTIESARVKSFFDSLNNICREMSRLTERPYGFHVPAKLLLHINQKQAKIEYGP